MRERQRGLNARQRRFVAAYIACRNAAEAARRAGYSPAGAGATGFKQLRKPAVLAALRAAGIETGEGGATLHPHWRDADGLNLRQRRFVAEYARSRNAQDAALRAGYAPRSAHTLGSRQLRHKAVIAALREVGVAIVHSVHPLDQLRKPRPPFVKTGLTARQRRFVEEFVACGNASEAGRRAGLSSRHPGASARRILREPLVAAAIAAKRAKLAERAQIDAARVLAEYARIAFASVADLLEWGPEGVRLKPGILDADLGAAVLELTLAADGAPGVRIKMQPKLQALEALGKHLGLWEKSAHGSGGGSRPKPERSEEQRADYERLRERIRSLVGAARAAAAKKAA